jgi:hypothetical protein
MDIQRKEFIFQKEANTNSVSGAGQVQILV